MFSSGISIVTEDILQPGNVLKLLLKICSRFMRKVVLCLASLLEARRV